MWGRREYTEVTAGSGMPPEYEHMSEAEMDAEIDRLYAELKESRGNHGRLPAKGSSG
jgi:hypothetical protein